MTTTQNTVFVNSFYQHGYTEHLRLATPNSVF